MTNADKLLELFPEMPDGSGYDYWGDFWDEEFKEPTERQGKWERQYSRPGVYANLYWWCSACKEATSYSDAGIFYRFCPNCGARMEKATDA